MQMTKKGTETMVGLFVVLGMLGLAFLSLKAANLGSFDGGQTYSVQARFDNVGGLKVRAPVRAAGVTVGRVKQISLDPKTYQGLVSLEIKSLYLFPKDSSMKILTAGLLGDQYLGIEPGADEQNLVPGQVVTQTQSAVVLENLIGQVLFNRAAESGSDVPAKP